MTPATALAVDLHTEPTEPIDQRVRLHDISWEDYEALLAMRGESSALRVTYLEGELEIMAPSLNHESGYQLKAGQSCRYRLESQDSG